MKTQDLKSEDIMKTEKFKDAQKSLEAFEEEITPFLRRPKKIIVNSTAGEWLDSQTLNLLDQQTADH